MSIVTNIWRNVTGIVTLGANRNTIVTTGKMITNISKGHSHFCKKVTNQDWIIGWSYDYYPKGVNWRATRKLTRYTDEKGAKKFIKKWSLNDHNI